MKQAFAARGETFGLNGEDSWALPTLRLLFSTPRAYLPLVEAWELAHGGVFRALDRLLSLGLVSYQPAVIVDTRNGETVNTQTRRVPRYRTTSRGRRLVAAIKEDARVLEDLFPRTAANNVNGVRALLEAFDLQDSHAKYGLSTQHATLLSGLPNSNVKWWIRALKHKRYLRELPVKYADVREVIPPHWRINKRLCKQVSDVLDAFDSAPQELRAEFRLNRSRYLADIDPARVGISGATDFEHDIECQRVVALLLQSPLAVPHGIFVVEPKIAIPADMSTSPWQFTPLGTGTVYYQPDVEMRERASGKTGRSFIEYERYQTRRDGWNHIERFLGHVHTAAVPSEPVILRFVVDSTARERGYVELIEAFADYAMDNLARLPVNPVTLAVSSVERLQEATDPLAAQSWFRVGLSKGGADTERRPVLHPAAESPFGEYFSRG